VINAPTNDATNSTDRIQELFDANQRMIGFFLGKYPKPDHLSYDEYVSELTIALWKSCRTYDSSITKFSTYAFRGMFMARGRLIQKWKKSIKPTELSRVEHRNSYSIDFDKSIFKSDCMEIIRELAFNLTSNQRRVVLLSLSGKNNNEIGRLIGRSPTTIGERYREAVRKMKKNATRRGIKCPI
jgi:RNA polymerase sigma factor (sigma-70 family)